MSSKTSEATTAAREEQSQDNKADATEQNPQANTPPVTSQGASQNRTATAGQQAGDAEGTASEAKPDVSDQDYQELLPKLLSYFHNSREELARALGLHRSTVDRWLNGKSRPNNSTVLRMRRLAQERRIE